MWYFFLFWGSIHPCIPQILWDNCEVVRIMVLSESVSLSIPFTSTVNALVEANTMVHERWPTAVPGICGYTKACLPTDITGHYECQRTTWWSMLFFVTVVYNNFFYTPTCIHPVSHSNALYLFLIQQLQPSFFLFARCSQTTTLNLPQLPVSIYNPHRQI